ncbi:hypothetical protein JTB14_031332 [Gonioctena quinquepunctata]|nr:hypothetical protein JTB14_031332 [Gonioctena quinquepunctata]
MSYWANNLKEALILLELEAELEEVGHNDIPHIVVIPSDCDELTDDEFIDDDVMYSVSFSNYWYSVSDVLGENATELAGSFGITSGDSI